MWNKEFKKGDKLVLCGKA